MTHDSECTGRGFGFVWLTTAHYVTRFYFPARSYQTTASRNGHNLTPICTLTTVEPKVEEGTRTIHVLYTRTPRSLPPTTHRQERFAISDRSILNCRVRPSTGSTDRGDGSEKQLARRTRVVKNGKTPGSQDYASPPHPKVTLQRSNGSRAQDSVFFVASSGATLSWDLA